MKLDGWKRAYFSFLFTLPFVLPVGLARRLEKLWRSGVGQRKWGHLPRQDFVCRPKNEGCLRFSNLVSKSVDYRKVVVVFSAIVQFSLTQSDSGQIRSSMVRLECANRSSFHQLFLSLFRGSKFKAGGENVVFQRMLGQGATILQYYSLSLYLIGLSPISFLLSEEL